MRSPLKLIIVAALVASSSSSAEEVPKANTERYLLRFEFDNDLFFETDSGFTAGWGLSLHSPARDGWEETSKISQWVGRVVPGLDSAAGDGRKVKTSTGFSQQLQTPTDLSNTALDLTDVPYAATLGAYFSWYALNEQRFRGAQIYAGVVGPAAQGEPVQEFIHNDLGWGPPPMGWEHQLSNEPLLNLNYEFKEKIAAWGTRGAGTFSSDLSGGAGLGLGNYFTGGFVQADWRFGWGLPAGFVTLVGGSGRDVGAVPVVDVPHDRWSMHFSITPRLIAYGYFVFYDGTLFSDSEHPGVEYDHFPVEIISGIHLSKKRLGLHYTATVYLDPVVHTPSGTRYDWGTISVDYLF